MDDASKRAEIGLCLMLAAADGEVSDAEVGALSTRLGKLLGDNVTARTIDTYITTEIRALDDLGPDGYIATLVERLPEPQRMPALRSALGVAFADGLAPEEEDTFREVASALGVDKLETDAMLELVPLSRRSVKPEPPT
jgi:tellurite resistance protein